MTDLENKQASASEATGETVQVADAAQIADEPQAMDATPTEAANEASKSATMVDKPADGIQHTAPVGVEEERKRAGEEPIVRIRNLQKSFDDLVVLRGVDLDVYRGEVVVILGPSGSGKSTMLRCINRLEEPTGGQIFFEDTEITAKDTDINKVRAKVGMVFQNFNLFPHLTAKKNVMLAQIKVLKRSKEEAEKIAVEQLERVGLGERVDYKPSQLSGGQQQRVAIARALVNEPKVLLLDEPLGALDLKLRKEMQGELMRIQKSLKITFIYVTHDQEEALTMSDRVVVMKDGEIQQIGTPQDIYNEPKNAFVADFIGESNIIDGVMYEDFEVEFAGQAFKCVDKGFAENERVDVVIRPEDIIVGDYETSPISGEVESVIFKGVHYEITVDAHGYKWLIHSTQSQPVGAHIGMNVRPEDIHIMKKMEAKAR